MTAVWLALASVLPPAAASPGLRAPGLSVFPAQAVVPVELTVSGSCDPLGSRGGSYYYPSRTTLSMPAAGITRAIGLVDGRFDDEKLALPADLPPR